MTYGLTYPSENSNNEFLLFISKDYESIAFQIINKINNNEYSNKPRTSRLSSPIRSRLSSTRSSSNKILSLLYILRTFSMLFNSQMSKYMFNKNKSFMNYVENSI